MQYKYMKQSIILLVLSIFLGGIFVMKIGTGQTTLAAEPIRAFNIGINVEHRDIFFEQLKSFSDKHAFAIRIAPTTPNDDQFRGQMWREDIRLTVVNPFEEGEYRIYFYKNNIETVREDVVDYLVSELEESIKEVPGATMSIRE